MRIDKFLKISRIIKRRTVAQDACDGGRIEVNGRDAKPSKDVKAGDIVVVHFGNDTVKIRILAPFKFLLWTFRGPFSRPGMVVHSSPIEDGPKAP